MRWDVCWVVYEPPGQLPTVALTAPTLAEVGPSALPGIVRGLYREYLGIGEANAMHLWVELAQLEVSRLTRRWHADNRLSRLWEAVNAALEQPWTVAALAEKAGMSGEHLRALCHKYLSRSPGKQVTYLRMQRASYLLKVTGWTVEKTAQAVGYDNAFAFSTAFKRWSGRSPSEFRAAAESTDGGPPCPLLRYALQAFCYQRVGGTNALSRGASKVGLELLLEQCEGLLGGDLAVERGRQEVRGGVHDGTCRARNDDVRLEDDLFTHRGVLPVRLHRLILGAVKNR